MSRRRVFHPVLIASVALLLLAGCKDRATMSNAELGLNQQQARGRRIFQHHCSTCHKAYDDSPLHGPSLKGLYTKKELPVSGSPVTDARVRDAVMLGRPNMPGYRGVLDERQVEDLFAYLKTL